MTSLPHDPYMAATANALAAWGLAPASWWSAEEDERLDGVFRWDAVPSEHWPHGVYLSWDQHTGWNLIETGGTRNLHRLPNCRTYCDPQQVASDTRALLAQGPDAITPGPITLDARWDLRDTQNAVQRWEATPAV
ncbi:hypothetical protein [Streptomyces microflavus]|uniref:hypothetical protein n=1 Tax=Streptomyces microflavus TaxID=1919 RepID=UPI002E2F7BD5|nr:hypothetical protein [Streptomyces microflavus]